jgi:hypothetical protein
VHYELRRCLLGSCRDAMLGTIVVFACSDWGKQRKIISRVEAWTKNRTLHTGDAAVGKF